MTDISRTSLIGRAEVSCERHDLPAIRKKFGIPGCQLRIRSGSGDRDFPSFRGGGYGQHGGEEDIPLDDGALLTWDNCVSMTGLVGDDLCVDRWALYIVEAAREKLARRVCVECERSTYSNTGGIYLYDIRELLCSDPVSLALVGKGQRRGEDTPGCIQRQAGAGSCDLRFYGVQGHLDCRRLVGERFQYAQAEFFPVQSNTLPSGDNFWLTTDHDQRSAVWQPFKGQGCIIHRALPWNGICMEKRRNIYSAQPESDNISQSLGQGPTRSQLDALRPCGFDVQEDSCLSWSKHEVLLSFSSPLSLSYQGKRYRITAEELADIVEIDPSGIAVGRPLTFDTDAARELLARRLHNVQSPPVNAQIVPNESGHGYTVIPSEKGTIIEWDVLLSSMLTVAATSERREVPIATTTANPQLTTRDAELLSNRRKIVSFTTYFSPSNQARAGNIRQVAQILDNTVIRPGEIFSFNKTAGPRTKAAGFDAAPLIRGGMLTPGVGGGICQVSTTLFNSVFFAGLPVVERHPHSFFIEHYPMGRDAAVSYGTLDFRFRDDSEQILLMTAETTEHSVSISLAAPEWHRRVSYETGHFYDLVQPNSTAENPRRLRDPELAPGEVSEMEPGVAGRKMNVRRVVRDERGEVLLEDEFQSNYAPKDYVVRVGGQ